MYIFRKYTRLPDFCLNTWGYCVFWGTVWRLY